MKKSQEFFLYLSLSGKKTRNLLLGANSVVMKIHSDYEKRTVFDIKMLIRHQKE